MNNLNDSQRRALDQLRELTNGGSDDVSIGVLESVDWNVERAAEAIFGGGASSSSSPSPPSNRRPSTPKVPMETFDIDDSAQNHNQISHRTTGGGTSMIYTFTRPIVSILAVPLHILGSLFRFIFNILRIPIPQLRFSTLNFYRPLRPRPSHRGGPDKWVAELEEELGAVSIGRLRGGPRGTASGVEAGPSRLTARNTQVDEFTDGKKLLPDFIISGYEEFLRRCQREFKVGCIILITEEHDDTAEFKRATLTDSDFVKGLYNNNILVWGGDVRDIEAWNASEKLQATTYPFIAFVALQPRRAPSQSTSSTTHQQQPVLTVLSRHQGKPYPSGTGPTSAQSILDHLDQQLLPRVTPFLERLRAEQRGRERDRQLREEQDRAFEEAARRDKERIEARMAAERAEAEAKRRAEEEARAAAVRREQELAAAKQREEIRMNWRRWTRKNITEPISKTSGSVRVAIRLATGTRLVQSFAPTTSLTTLYAYVDSQLIPSEFEAQDDPCSPPEGSAVGEEAIEAQIRGSGGGASWWGFQLATAYPRSEIAWKSGVQLGDLSVLKGGGQIVVEMLGSPRSSVDGRGDEDEEYKTESDEE